jgi:WD40 repeat protein
MADSTQGAQGAQSPTAHNIPAITSAQTAGAQTKAGYSHDSGKLKVFISYSRQDLKFADQLDAALSLTGFDVAIDRHGIDGGENWKRRLGQLIRDADTVIFVVSPTSARSEICAWEVDEALRLSKRVLPIVCDPLGNAEPSPKLQDLNYVFFYDEPSAPGSGFGVGLARLVEALNTDIEWVREHTRLLARATEWDESGRPENRLLFGSVIADAKAWAARRPKNAPELTPLHLDFIRASEEAETLRTNEAHQQLARIAAAQEERARALADKEVEQKHRARLQLFMVAGALVVALGFAAFGLFSWRLYLTSEARKNEAVESDARAVAQARIAEAEARVAEEQKQLARANLEKEATTAALFRATQAESALKAGDASTAILLALEALPDVTDTSDESKSHTVIPEAVTVLRSALGQLREEKILAAHTKEVRGVAFSKDGAFLATGSADKTAIVWKIDDTHQPFQILKGHEDSVNAVAFSPDGTELVTASDDGVVREWEIRSGEPILTLRHGIGVTSVRFSPNGKEIATGAADGQVRLWNVSDGSLAATLSGHQDEVTSLAFSSGSDQLASGSADGTVVLWNLATKQRVKTFPDTPAPSEVLGVAFSADGRRIASGFGDGTVEVWDPKSGKLEVALVGHLGPVNSVGFSSDGRRIVTGSADRTVRLWSELEASPLVGIDAASAGIGWSQEVLLGHEQPVLSVAFSPKGDAVVSTSEDGTARIWKSDPASDPGLQNASIQELVTLARARVPRCLTQPQRDVLRLVSKVMPWCGEKWTSQSSHTSVQTGPSAGARFRRRYEWHLMENGTGRGRSPGGINWVDAVRYTTGDPSVVVAVLSTGLRRDVITQSNVLPGYNFSSRGGRSNDPTDPGDACPPKEPSNSWQGTTMARQIVPLVDPDSSSVVRPIAPNVSILPIRVLGKCGGNFSDISAGVRWAAGLPVAGTPRNPHPADIILTALGGALPCTDELMGLLKAAISDAVAAGTVIIVSAGDGQSALADVSPAGCPHVVAVAASDERGHLAKSSNFGNGTALIAPAENLGGTSVSATITAGVVALGLSTHPELRRKPDLIAKRLKDTAYHRTSDECPNGCGAGLLNAEAFVRPN